MERDLFRIKYDCQRLITHQKITTTRKIKKAVRYLLDLQQNNKNITTSKTKIEARYIFFKQLDLEGGNKFEIDFNIGHIVESLNFSTRRRYSVTNLKIKGNIKSDITKTKWNDYNNIHELSNFCQKLIKESKTFPCTFSSQSERICSSKL